MITVDVGVHHFAYARWRDGWLMVAEYVDQEPLDAGAVTLEHAVAVMMHDVPSSLTVIEVPRHYDAQHQKGDQKDIRDLALAAGGLIVTARFAMGVPGERVPVEKVEPRTWKGTVDKKVMLARIWDKLSYDERECVRLTAKQVSSGIQSGKGPGADVLDAIGIGLWKLGRLNKGRTR